MLMEEDLQQQYPEEIYFRNLIIIGGLAKHMDLDKLFTYDVSFWKLKGKRVIPDLRDMNLRAVILIYEDEESARICKLRFKNITSINFTPYDGLSLFYYCKLLDLTCDARCRNVLISGINCDKSKDTYLDLLGIFGTICYFEFCLEGEIPKIRVEFTRATSAFAAILCLQMDRDSIITMEIPLFPVSPIGPMKCSTLTGPTKIATNDTSYVTEQMKEQAFMLCTMNIYQQDQHTLTNVQGIPENMIYQRESIEEVSFGISRKLFREKLNSSRIISKYVQDYFDRNTQENIKRFLQSSKNII